MKVVFTLDDYLHRGFHEWLLYYEELVADYNLLVQTLGEEEVERRIEHMARLLGYIK